MNSTTKKIKSARKTSKKSRIDLTEELEKMHTSKKTDNIEGETEAKISAIEYYNSLSEVEKREFDKELEKKKVRDNYVSYLKYVYGKNYVLTKFHLALANVAESIVRKVENGQNIVVLLSVPPQFGKSKTITECLPSWFIMRNPDKGVILCSYNADFAEKFGDSNRQKVKEFGKGLFGLEVSDSQDNKTLFQIKKHEGQVLSTGIFGTLTGNPASLLIIDDPYKSNLEADSEDYRNKVYGVVKSAAETRLNPMGSALVIIHTRWHEDDLIGRYKEEDGVIYINIPCVWESTMGVDKLLHRKAGEVLAPELGHTTEWVERKQKSLGKKIFNALYQGKPFIEGGNIVQRKDLKWYNKKTIPHVFEELNMSCDLSFGGQKTDNDPSCITIWGRVGADHYLLKIVNKRMSFNETLERLQFLSGEFPTMRKKIVEKKANGSATIEMLNSKVGGFIPYDPKGDSKETRLRLVAPYFESGNIYFPEESVEPNIEEYVNQLLKFPSVAHDDFVDTISQYLINYSYKYGGKIRTDSYYNDISDVFRGIKI